MQGKKHLKQNADHQLDDTAKVFLLDIDGVINEAQQPITLCMQQRLHALARRYQVYFVTGNSYTKSVDILNGPIGMYAGVFCNSGDELRSMRGKLVWRDEVTEPLPASLEDDLMRHLFTSSDNPWCEHWGNRIDWRSARFINYSRIGRNAKNKDRIEHDATWRDRVKETIEFCHPSTEASIGGAVSIDIYSKGADKSRAAKWVNDQGKNFVFIGDKTDVGGNDHCVKMYCETHTKNTCFTSKGPQHTMEIINTLLG